ncbi:MAG: hypothetical protein ABSC51_00975 [Gaiellaceae bacterium]|jgi:hypothetical protein
MRRSTYPLLAPLVVVALAASSCGGKSAAKTVTVPRTVAQTDVIHAYDLLHKAGLRVAIRSPFTINPLRYAIPLRFKPGPGSVVRPGSVVTITEVISGPSGSPSDRDALASARVPDFTGRSPAAVERWAEANRLYWYIRRLPALPASGRPHLFDSYRVVSQVPPPGSILHGALLNPGDGIRPTPITVSTSLRPTS